MFTFLLLVALVAKCLCGSVSGNSSNAFSSTNQADQEDFVYILFNVILPTMFALVVLTVLGYCCYCLYQGYVHEQKHKQLHQSDDSPPFFNSIAGKRYLEEKKAAAEARAKKEADWLAKHPYDLEMCLKEALTEPFELDREIEALVESCSKPDEQLH